MSRVTVIMPVYNASKFLEPALDSIIKQTFSDFVLFAIDDGSSDASLDILNRYMQQDSRIVSFSQENRGLISTLNSFFGKAETEYIARMDADDISLPKRFEKQVSYLDQNTEIGAVGTGIKYVTQDLSCVIDEANFPDSHGKILWKMLYTTGVPHAPIMLRKELFAKTGGYAADAVYVEDYDFFHRAKQFTRFANLQEILYVYRQNEESVSQKFSPVQKENHIGISKREIKSLLPAVNDEFVQFLKYDTLSIDSNVNQIYFLMEKLYSNFTLQNELTSEEKKFVKKDWIKKLKILSLTYKNYSFWTGLELYCRTLAKEIMAT